MQQVLIVKNIEREGPGLLGEVLHAAGLGFEVVDLSSGQTFPAPTDYQAVVVLGGPASANDQTTTIIEELAQIKAALDRGVPCLGICLGMQLLVKARGGQVAVAPQIELGLVDPEGRPYKIELTASGQQSPLLAGLGRELDVFHLHGETVELTDDMQLLGTGKWCKNQIVQVADNAYGIQSHFELTPEMLAVWAEQDPDLIPLGAQQLQADFQNIQNTYAQTGKTLFGNFLRIAGLF